MILEAPLDQTVDSTNAPVTLFVRAEGYPYPSYQWFRNGVLMPGQTNDVFVAPVEEASYHVAVSNALGSTSSAEFRITVRRIPTIAEALDTPGVMLHRKK